MFQKSKYIIFSCAIITASVGTAQPMKVLKYFNAKIEAHKEAKRVKAFKQETLIRVGNVLVVDGDLVYKKNLNYLDKIDAIEDVCRCICTDINSMAESELDTELWAKKKESYLSDITKLLQWAADIYNEMEAFKAYIESSPIYTRRNINANSKKQLIDMTTKIQNTVKHDDLDETYLVQKLEVLHKAIKDSDKPLEIIKFVTNEENSEEAMIVLGDKFYKF